MTQPTTQPAGDPPTTDPTPPANPVPTNPVPTPLASNVKDDKPLGPPGEKALQAEREARLALEKRFSRLAAAFGDGDAAKGKSDVELLNERFDSYEKQLSDERQARWRAEIVAETGIPAALAARLQGSTRDELLADAAALKALIPEPAGPRTPAPDPSQGARGTQPPDLENQIAEAQKAGNIRQVIALQKQKLANTK